MALDRADYIVLREEVPMSAAVPSPTQTPGQLPTRPRNPPGKRPPGKAPPPRTEREGIYDEPKDCPPTVVDDGYVTIAAKRAAGLAPPTTPAVFYHTPHEAGVGPNGRPPDKAGPGVYHILEPMADVPAGDNSKSLYYLASPNLDPAVMTRTSPTAAPLREDVYNQLAVKGGQLAVHHRVVDPDGAADDRNVYNHLKQGEEPELFYAVANAGPGKKIVIDDVYSRLGANPLGKNGPL